MKISCVFAMAFALILSGSTAIANGLVEKAKLEDLIRVEYHEDGPGKVSGIIRNQSSTQVKDSAAPARFTREP